MKVDFSPDGTRVGVCADKGVYVIDIQNPGTMKTVLALPGQASGSDGTTPSLSCDNLRWSPDGQSLLVQLFVSGITEYGFIGGWTIISLNGSPPQVIYGCNITATNTGLLVSGEYSPDCQAVGAERLSGNRSMFQHTLKRSYRCDDSSRFGLVIINYDIKYRMGHQISEL